MISLLLDTNIIIDALSAEILGFLNCNFFTISNVVLHDEILTQVPNFVFNAINIFKEGVNEIIMAQQYSLQNKSISFYDALNFTIAKNNDMTLVTGDQRLRMFANENGVKCIGTLTLLEIMLENHLINVEETIEALRKLKEDSSRRIPKNLIDLYIEKIRDKYCITV